MEHFDYKTQYTCAKQISFDMEDGCIKNISFSGGCPGNLKALSTVLEGSRAEDIVEKLSGNLCAGKPTSCADQLAKAVKAALESKNE